MYSRLRNELENNNYIGIADVYFTMVAKRQWKAMSTVKVTCGHVELGKRVVCDGCFKTLESERDQLKAENEKLLWNLAGCLTYAEGWDDGKGHNKEMETPALVKVRELNIDCNRWRDLAGKMAEAIKATDIYFKALCEQWAANDGRVVSESGVVIDAGANCERLCDEAGMKVGEALAFYEEATKEK